MTRAARNNSQEVRGVWSVPEHERFIEAMALYPRGPWKQITDHVGTRSIKQVQTHAQKYQQKLMRHQRGLRKRKTKLTRPEHRVDAPTLGQFTHKCIVRYAQRVSTTERPLGSRLTRGGPSTSYGQDDEDDDDEEDEEEDEHSESLVPQSPHASETSDTSDTTDASDAATDVVPESPPSFVGLHLIGGSCEEWEETTEDIANDPTFMHLMVDVDPVEPAYTRSYDRSQDWAEWQFADLLKPYEDSPFVEGASQLRTRPCTV